MNDIRINEKTKYSILETLAVYSICAYIATVFVFSYDANLNSISRLVFLGMVACCVMCMLEHPCNKIISKFGLWGICIFVLSAISILWSIDTSFALSKAYTVFQLIVLFICVYSVIDSPKKLNTVMVSIIFSSYIMYFYLFYILGFENTIAMFEDGLRIGSEVNQENAFGYYSVIAFALTLYKMIYDNKKIYFILLPLPLIMGLMSGSKKSLLLLVLVIFLLITLKDKKHIISRLLWSLLIMAVVGYVLYELGFLDLVFRRIESAVGGDDGSTNLRISYIEFGFNKFLEKPLFGYGIEHFEILYSERYSIIAPSHNNYIQLLISFGVFGLVFWYSSYFCFLKTSINNLFKNKLSPILFMLVIVFIINDITTTTLTNKFTYIILALCFSICTIIRKENSSGDKNE